MEEQATQNPEQPPQPKRPIDSEWGRAIIGTLVVLIGILTHFILAKWMESWSMWQLVITAVCLAVPAAIWTFWPEIALRGFRRAWSFWKVISPVIGVTAVGAVILIGSYYWINRKHSSVSKIRFTCDTWIGWSPIFIAKQKGFFGDTEVEIIPGHGSGEKRTLVYRGQADAIGETVDMLEFSSSPAAVAPGTILWSADRSNGGDAIVASNTISTYRDLIDKTIGLEVGTPTHFMLAHYFAADGLPMERLRIKDLLVPDSTEEFLDHTLDATAEFYPHLRLALKRSGGHIILSSKEMVGDNSIRDVVAINPSFLKEHCNAVRDFYVGWCAAIKFMKIHPDEAHEIMAANLNITPRELEQELQTVEFYGEEENVQLFQSHPKSQIVGNVLQVRSTWQAAGFSRRVESIESRVSAEIVESVSVSDIDHRLQSALRQ